MGLDVRKPVFIVSDQEMLKQDCHAKFLVSVAVQTKSAQLQRPEILHVASPAISLYRKQATMTGFLMSRLKCLSEFHEVKRFSYPTVLTFALAAQKNRLIVMDLLSTHNIIQ